MLHIILLTLLTGGKKFGQLKAEQSIDLDKINEVLIITNNDSYNNMLLAILFKW